MTPEIDREPIDQDVELRPAHRARICKLMLKLGGYDYGEPGSFVRSHHNHLDRLIRTADHEAEKERMKRKERAANRE